MKNVIMYDDPTIVSYQTDIAGWVGSDGRFYGDKKDSEHIARWASCTHMKCACGRQIMEKMYTACADCRAKKDKERFDALPAREWKGEPICEYKGDRFIFSECDLRDYIDDLEGDVELQFVFCDPCYAPYIEEYAYDDLPEGFDDISDIDVELADLIDAVNNYISKNKPIISWYPGKERVIFKKEDLK